MDNNPDVDCIVRGYMKNETYFYKPKLFLETIIAFEFLK